MADNLNFLDVTILEFIRSRKKDFNYFDFCNYLFFFNQPWLDYISSEEYRIQMVLDAFST